MAQVDETIMREVRRILFDDCKNTATWDHLGNADPVTSQRKGVSIGGATYFDDDLILLDLPRGLGSLFSIISGVSGATRYCPSLRHLLETAATPPPPVDPCHALFELAERRKEKVKEVEKKRQQEEQDRIQTECSFRPTLSKAADERPTKGLANFIKDSMAWKKGVTERLAKKAEKFAQESVEDIKPWAMNERSRRIVVQSEKRRQQEAADELKGASPPFSRVREVSEPVSFAPVTKVNSNRITVEMFVRESSPDCPAAVAITQREFVQRLLDDAKEREVRAEERKRHYDELKQESMYDPETGQELFSPNAPPTLRVGDKRVPYSQLSTQQQEELRKSLQSRHCAHVVKISGMKTKTQRSIDEIVATIDEKVKQREQQIERIKRNDEKEKNGWFKPTIDPLSAQTAESKGRIPMHKKTLPKPEAPPPPPPKPKSSAKEMNNLVARNAEWAQQREKVLAKKRAELQKEELSEVTGKPKIHSSLDLVVAAEQRFSAEVQVARQQHRDAMSAGSIDGRSASVQSSSMSLSVNKESSGALRRQRASAVQSTSASPLPVVVEATHFSPMPQIPRDFAIVPRSVMPDATAAAAAAVEDDGLQGLLDSWKELELQTDLALRNH